MEKGWNYSTHFCHSARKIALAILKNHRRGYREGKPEAKKLFMQLDPQLYKFLWRRDRISVGPGISIEYTNLKYILSINHVIFSDKNMDFQNDVITSILMKRAKKRGSLELKMDVLRVISLGVEKPTRIMSIVSVSWTVMQSLLSEFLQKGLIEEIRIGRRRIYRITEKGKNILEQYDILRSSV